MKYTNKATQGSVEAGHQCKRNAILFDNISRDAKLIPYIYRYRIASPYVVIWLWNLGPGIFSLTKSISFLLATNRLWDMASKKSRGKALPFSHNLWASTPAKQSPLLCYPTATRILGCLLLAQAGMPIVWKKGREWKHYLGWISNIRAQRRSAFGQKSIISIYGDFKFTKATQIQMFHHR